MHRRKTAFKVAVVLTTTFQKNGRRRNCAKFQVAHIWKEEQLKLQNYTVAKIKACVLAALVSY